MYPVLHKSPALKLACVLLILSGGLATSMARADSSMAYDTERAGNRATARVNIRVSVPVRVRLTVTANTEAGVSLSSTGNTLLATDLTDAVYTVAAP